MLVGTEGSNGGVRCVAVKLDAGGGVVIIEKPGVTLLDGKPEVSEVSKVSTVRSFQLADTAWHSFSYCVYACTKRMACV